MKEINSFGLRLGFNKLWFFTFVPLKTQYTFSLKNYLILSQRITSFFNINSAYIYNFLLKYLKTFLQYYKKKYYYYLLNLLVVKGGNTAYHVGNLSFFFDEKKRTFYLLQELLLHYRKKIKQISIFLFYFFLLKRYFISSFYYVINNIIFIDINYSSIITRFTYLKQRYFFYKNIYLQKNILLRGTKFVVKSVKLYRLYNNKFGKVPRNYTFFYKFFKQFRKKNNFSPYSILKPFIYIIQRLRLLKKFSRTLNKKYYFLLKNYFKYNKKDLKFIRYFNFFFNKYFYPRNSRMFRSMSARILGKKVKIPTGVLKKNKFFIIRNRLIYFSKKRKIVRQGRKFKSKHLIKKSISKPKKSILLLKKKIKNFLMLLRIRLFFLHSVYFSLKNIGKNFTDFSKKLMENYMYLKNKYLFVLTQIKPIKNDYNILLSSRKVFLLYSFYFKIALEKFLQLFFFKKLTVCIYFKNLFKYLQTDFFLNKVYRVLRKNYRRRFRNEKYYFFLEIFNIFFIALLTKNAKIFALYLAVLLAKTRKQKQIIAIVVSLIQKFMFRLNVFTSMRLRFVGKFSKKLRSSVLQFHIYANMIKRFRLVSFLNYAYKSVATFNGLGGIHVWFYKGFKLIE